MFPMNGTPQPGGDRSITRRYLDWLLSQIGGRSNQAVSNIMGAPLANLGIASQPLNVPQPMPQEPVTPTNVSASDLLGAGPQARGSYTLPSWARDAPGSFGGVSAPQVTPQPVPSGMNRDALLGYLQNYLNIGGYFPAGRYPREYFNEIADEFDAAMKTIATKQKDAEFNPVETDYLIRQEANPEDARTQKMLGYFEEIKSRIRTPEGIINDDWELTVDEQEQLKDFASYFKTQTDAKADLAAQEVYVSTTFDLPDPATNWDINPEIAAQLWTRQKTGLTERQAQEQELRAAQEALPYFVPRTRQDITADVMRQYQSEEQAATRDKPWLQKFDSPSSRIEDARTARTAAAEAGRSGASADRAEAAGRSAVQKSKAPTPNAYEMRIAKEKEDKKRKEMQKTVEERVWTEGYKAMRGEKVKGGAEYQRVRDAETRVSQAKSFEDELAIKIAEQLTSMYGRPYDAALEEAKRYVTSKGKTYNYPGGPTGGKP